jgi:hypothetical protein
MHFVGSPSLSLMDSDPHFVMNRLVKAEMYLELIRLVDISMLSKHR